MYFFKNTFVTFNEMETNYFGIVTLTSIENIRPSNDTSNEKTATDDLMDESRVRLVHYPDCQQLIIWLPVDGIHYLDMVICDQKTKDEIWRKDIREIINGTIQIILDTLPFGPGELFIKITKKNGLQHIINLKKYDEGVIPIQPVISPEIVPEEDKAPIIYRDGFGNIIPDQDLILRENVFNELYRKFSRRVKYEGAGRSNNVIFVDGNKILTFYSEMGGGNCLFYIDIPAKENWVNETGYSLDERDEILQFVAESTLRDQTTSSGAYFEIEDKWITFYKGPKK
ncbi:MAG: hypothetical protein KA161_11335 [Saprospiraceae bacterium]|nr:hypothetical protein [Saprospiraceae bacterium]